MYVARGMSVVETRSKVKTRQSLSQDGKEEVERDDLPECLLERGFRSVSFGDSFRSSRADDGTAAAVGLAKVMIRSES